MQQPETVCFCWALSDALLAKRLPKNPWLAVCSRTLRVAKIATDTLTPLIVQDAILGGGTCEEGTRCLDLQCDLNKTTWESLNRALGRKRTPKPPEAGFLPGQGINALMFTDLAEKFAKHHGTFYLAKAPARRKTA